MNNDKISLSGDELDVVMVALEFMIGALEKHATTYSDGNVLSNAKKIIERLNEDFY